MGRRYTRWSTCFHHHALYMKSTVEHLEYSLAAQVTHALYRPIRKGLERLEARPFMSIYQDEASHSKAWLKLAKLHFNLLQSLYKKELSNISRFGLTFGRPFSFIELYYCPLHLGSETTCYCHEWTIIFHLAFQIEIEYYPLLCKYIQMFQLCLSLRPMEGFLWTLSRGILDIVCI